MPAPAVYTDEDAAVRDYVLARVKPQGTLTQAALARELGMTRYALNRRLNQEKPFTWTEVVRLAFYFGVTLDEIQGGHGAKPAGMTP